MSKRKELEDAIAALEDQRSVLGDSVVNSAIAAMQKQLDEISEDRQPPKHQRKLITVLFMDVVSSTKLMLELDPEESLSIMDGVLKQLAIPVENHGGRVTRFMGDGYLAIFGLPTASENDPEMAVRAGLAILKKSNEIASQLEKEWKLTGFQVRIGVNTGLVVTGGETEAEDTIMGNAVNLAARLESSAPSGGLLISQYTHQHIQGLFEEQTREKISVKGFSEPIQVYLVKNAKDSSFRLMTRGIEGIETSMVGRDNELLLLEDTYKSAAQNKKGEFVTVIGDAGIGKSRLLNEFEEWMKMQSIEFDVFKGRAMLEMQNLPRSLIRDVLASKIGILDDDPMSIVQSKIDTELQETLDSTENLETSAILVGHLLGYDFRHKQYIQNLLDNPKQLYEQGFSYLVKFFKRRSENALLVFFLDDMHW
ncbi:MAG: adenylate/guanylate cyclase domain-containing protein, partial [Candidatus Kariarchaeaceae archaeon]